MKDQDLLLRPDFEQQTGSTKPAVGSNQSYLGENEGEQGTLWRLVRINLPYSICLVLLGSIAGFSTVVLQAPVFKARVMLEVNAINESYLKSSLDPLSGSFDPNAVNVQTQIKLLQVGPVTKQVYDQMLHEPPPQMQPRGTFAAIRTRLRGAAAARAEVSQTVALRMDVSTFDARPVSGTRLIELSCESTNPELAAGFLNNVADRFIKDGDRSRTESAERTGLWLSKQLQETDAKLRKAESNLQQFVVAAGNDFAAPDSMLAEAELKQLQTDFVKAQAERLAKQARFEADARGDENSIPEVADDIELHELRRRISDIRDQREVLAATLTPKHYKMQRLDEAEKELLAAAKERTNGIIARIRSEYDSALHKQDLLAAAYREKGGAVIATSAKVTEYNALKRDADSLKVDRDTLVQRINQSGSSTSLPVGLIRLVEPSLPPGQPYKPNPVTQIGLGAFGGLMASLLFAIGREKLDKSIRAPGAARSMLQVPELGVIPSANRLRSRARHQLLRETRSSGRTLAEGVAEISIDSGIWGDGAGVMAESFRNTVASLIREASNGSRKVIMITSPEPGDGKTTIASNLAIALAESGKKVVVIDADFRRPKLRTAFHLLDDVDITQVLLSDVSLENCPIALLASATLMPRLWISPNRAPTNKLSELIYSPRISDLIRRMRREFDFVLVDVPPVLQLADARVFSRYVDGAALVIRAGQTDRRLAAAACQCLVDDRIPVFGTILNQWDPSGSPVSSYYYQEMSEES